MLSVAPYHHSHEAFELEFLKDNTKETIIVCPSPSLADDFRFNYKANSNVDIITISKFISDEMESFTETSVSRKAELLLHLGSIWKKLFSDAPDELFFQVFNLYTELRSFSVHLDLIQNIFEAFDETTAKAIEVFWRYTEQAELIDEHQAYHLIAENHRSLLNEVPQGSRNFVFWGFGHMSGVQVDLLKALAIRDDVYIPFSKKVLEELHSYDWVTWILKDDTISAVNHPEDQTPKLSANIISFPKNRLAETLKCFDHDKTQLLDVFLAQKNPSLSQLTEVSFSNLSFKSQADLFSHRLSIELRNMRESLFSAKKVSMKSCLEYFDERINDEREKNFFEKDFRSIKVLLICLDAFHQMEELSDVHDELNLFDLKLIEEVCLLNIPRNYSLPLNEKEGLGNVRGLEGLGSYSSKNQTILCVTSAYQSLKGSDNNHDDQTMEFLSSIGPVQRRELDFLQTKQRLIEILSEKNTILFMEKGQLEHDLAWSEIIDSFDEIVSLPLRANNKERETVKDYLAPVTEKINESKQKVSFSATKLQTFIDCPKLYYYKYVDRLDIRPEFERSLRPDQLGILEHDIIRLYFEKYQDWNPEKHERLVLNTFEDFLQKEKIQLAPLEYKAAFLELLTYSQNGIDELYKILKIDARAEFFFEYDLAKLPGTENIRGSVDCLIKSSLGIGVLDFKRSGAGVPSIKEIDNFEKIQLWFYLNNLDFSPEDYSFWGYLNLSNPSESRVLVKEKSLLTQFKDIWFMQGKVSAYKKDLAEEISSYQDFYDKLAVEIKNEEKFLPKPRKSSVCTFCPVNSLCPRTGVVQ